MTYQCLIVEDELPAQRILKKFIEDVPNLSLLGTCTSAMAAVSFLQKGNVDVLFLDINLPRISGIDFLKTLRHPPLVIFTTAYAEYAVEGFELEATDYLLKPFSFERFLKAVNKATDLLSERGAVQPSQPSSPADAIASEPFVFVKADKKMFRIDLQSVLYVESLKDYVRIVTDNEEQVVLQTLKHWETVLPEKLFCRVHKSYIVNVRWIDAVEGGTLFLRGNSIPIGRTYRDQLLTRIDKHLLG